MLLKWLFAGPEDWACQPASLHILLHLHGAVGEALQNKMFRKTALLGEELSVKAGSELCIIAGSMCKTELCKYTSSVGWRGHPSSQVVVNFI